MTKRRVVVTGVGALSPVGNDVATTWRSLIEGRSGAAPITKFDASKFQVRFAEVKGFDPLQHGPEGGQARRRLHAAAVPPPLQAMKDAAFAAGNGLTI